MSLRAHARWRLLLPPVAAALVAMLLLALVGTVAYQQNRQSVRAQAAARVRSNQEAAVHAVSRQSQDFLRTTEAGARDPDIVAALSAPGPATRSSAEAPLAALALGKAAPSAFLSDVRGRYVVGHPFLTAYVGVGFAYRDWFRGASSSGHAYVSSGYHSVARGRPRVVGVAAPVYDGDRRVGYLTLLWQLASIRSVAEGSRRDDGISITVTDQRGRPLTGERAATTDRKVVAAGGVPHLGWTVTATLPMSTAMKASRAFRKSLVLTLAIALLTLLGALAYAVLISGRRAQERAQLTAQAEHLTALFAASPVGIIEGRPDGTILAVNDELARMLGYAEEELLTLKAGDLAHPSSVAAVGASLSAVVDGSVTSYTAERVYRARSGAAVPVLVSLVVLRNAMGKLDRMVACVMDLTGMRAAEAALETSEDRFRKVFDEGLIGKALTAETGVILHANRALAEMLGRGVDELRGQMLTSCFEAVEDKARISDVLASTSAQLNAELPLHRSSGAESWGRVAVRWMQEEGTDGVLLAQFEDITAQRIAERRLMDLALHDDLTGLPNRRLLMERCAQVFAVARSGRSGSFVTALFLDLDGFKAVNDRVGHDAGDQLLKSVATDLLETLRPADTLARVGGDEFVVLLDTDDGLDAGRLVADRLAHLVRRRIPCGADASLPVSASIGIARVDLSVEPDLVPEQLLRRADAAMYRAKQRGRDRQEVFDSELLASTEARYELEQAVRDGLLHDRIHLVFQAVVDVDSGVVLGAEALMRLVDAAGRLLPTLPAVMAAEQAALAPQLGDRVLDLAMEALRSWPSHMSLAVNVSARELTGDAFRQRVEDALRRHEVDPARLMLEVTESSIMNAGRSSLGALQALRERGVRVAIDDFGTAYATLQNLTVLPVDVIKVDASFTAGLGRDRTATAVIRGVITMADAMDVPCIIEGIETQSQHDALLGLGVQGQGWLWGKPRGREVTPSAFDHRTTHTPRLAVPAPRLGG